MNCRLSFCNLLERSVKYQLCTKGFYRLADLHFIHTIQWEKQEAFIECYNRQLCIGKGLVMLLG